MDLFLETAVAVSAFVLCVGFPLGRIIFLRVVGEKELKPEREDHWVVRLGHGIFMSLVYGGIALLVVNLIN